MKKIIDFKDVTKTYKIGEIDIKALNGVSFDINEGEWGFRRRKEYNT